MKISHLLSPLFIFCANLVGNEHATVDELIAKQFGADQFVYCPWREAYSNSSKTEIREQCPFCEQINTKNDERYFIIQRFKYHAIMLNIFPHTKGHLLIVPYSHVATLSELAPEIRAELINLIALSIDVLKATIGFDAVNFGVNMGRAAGASIPNHIHAHIVPRKLGNCGITHMISGIKFINWDMHALYALLKKAFTERSFVH